MHWKPASSLLNSVINNLHHWWILDQRHRPSSGVIDTICIISITTINMITFSNHLHDNHAHESSYNHFHQIKLSTILGHTLGSLHVDANLGIILFQSAQIHNVRFCQKSCWTVQNKLTALTRPHVVFWAPGNTLVQGVFHAILTYALPFIERNYNSLRWIIRRII